MTPSAAFRFFLFLVFAAQTLFGQCARIVAPSVSPAAKSYVGDSIQVAIHSNCVHKMIIYTLDGSDPDPNRPGVGKCPYGCVITIHGTGTLKTRADGEPNQCPHWYDHDVLTATYTQIKPPPTPTIDTDRGIEWDGPMVITLSADRATSIHYTIDGREPSKQSTSYTGPFSVYKTATIKAKAFNESGGEAAESSVTEKAITILPAVAEVALAEYYSPLDQNPGPGGGLRIFPDLPWKGWDEQHRPQDLVRVIVRVYPARATTVYLQAVDVLDPSAADDAWSKATDLARTWPAGNDNLARTKRVNGVGVWSQNTTLVQTGGDGVGSTLFAVSMQPGDNYVFVASTVSRLLPAFPQPNAGYAVLDARIAYVPNESVQASPMLTVWRRLFVETDRMDPVRGNTVRGTVKAVRFNPPGVSSTINVGLSLKSVENRFVNGTLTIEGFGSMNVLASSKNPHGDDTVLVLGNLAQAVGRSFTLVDDDVKDGYGDGCAT